MFTISPDILFSLIDWATNLSALYFAVRVITGGIFQLRLDGKEPPERFLPGHKNNVYRRYFYISLAFSNIFMVFGNLAMRTSPTNLSLEALGSDEGVPCDYWTAVFRRCLFYAAIYMQYFSVDYLPTGLMDAFIERNYGFYKVRDILGLWWVAIFYPIFGELWLFYRHLKPSCGLFSIFGWSWEENQAELMFILVAYPFILGDLVLHLILHKGEPQVSGPITPIVVSYNLSWFLFVACRYMIFFTSMITPDNLASFLVLFKASDTIRQLFPLISSVILFGMVQENNQKLRERSKKAT